MESIPPDLFLDGFPLGIRAVADRLREVVLAEVPDAVKRVRIGWRLIGYDVPVGAARLATMPRSGPSRPAASGG